MLLPEDEGDGAMQVMKHLHTVQAVQTVQRMQMQGLACLGWMIRIIDHSVLSISLLPSQQLVLLMMLNMNLRQVKGRMCWLHLMEALNLR